MSVNDLTGQNIQDTYQKVVQTDGTNLADGTGSLLPISFDGNNVIISGALSATEYTVTSSVTNVVFQQQSGSTIFGDSQDDTHLFTGNITASGNISASGEVQAGTFVGDGSGLTNVSSLITEWDGTRDGDAQITGSLILSGSGATNLNILGDITASGHISSSGNIYASESIYASKFRGLHGNTDYIEFNSEDTIFIQTSGQNKSAFTEGGVTFNYNGSDDMHFTVKGDSDASLIKARADHDKVGIGIVPDGSTSKLHVVGTFTATSHITASSHISSSETITAAQITASGNISADNFLGNIFAADASADAYLELNKAQFKTVLHQGGTSGLIVTPDTIELIREVTASGNISASGDIIATGTGSFGHVSAGGTINALDLDGYYLASTQFAKASGGDFYFGNIGADTILQGSSVTLQPNGGSVLISSNNIDATATLTTFKGNVSSSGQLRVDGAITASRYLISGSGGQRNVAFESFGATYLSDATYSTQILGSAVTLGFGAIPVNAAGLVSFTGDVQLGNATSDKVSISSSLFAGSHITASGNISSSGDILTSEHYVGHRRFNIPTATGATQGDIIYVGVGSTTEGRVHYYSSSGEWGLADKDAAATATGLLAIALGTDPDADGMLLRGMYRAGTDLGTVADILYVGDDGATTNDVSGFASPDIIRIVGYCLGSTNGEMWFNPDMTWVEKA